MRSRFARASAVFTAALVACIAGGIAAPQAASAAVRAAGAPPSSMASLGDSITRGFDACGWYRDCTAESWSTGDDAAINSHYLRILAVNPAIGGHNLNDARTGARASDLAGQAQTAPVSTSSTSPSRWGRTTPARRRSRL